MSPRYLSDAGGEDLATMRRGLELSRRWISESAAWGEGVIGEEVYPGAAEDDLDAYIRRTLHTSNALVGTCRMGVPDEHGDVVVDASSLALRGVEGVVVADASVIPRIPGGQTVAPTIMIAERAAEMLLHGEGAAVDAAGRAHHWEKAAGGDENVRRRRKVVLTDQ